MVLVVIVCLVIAVLGVAAVGMVAGMRLMRRHTSLLRAQVEADRDLAVEAAVSSVLAEREATVRAVAAERDITVQSVVDTTMQVANDKLGASVARGSQELDLRNKAISQQVDGMNTQLAKLNEAVQSLHRDRATQHGQVVEQLKAAQHTTQALADTTQTLREALASPKARGQWGERMAADVLRAAGFTEGVSFRQQTAIANGAIPDFTFLLPHGLVLHMDVKFPFANYINFLDADTPTDADRARAEFARDVRKHVKSLSDRGYVDPPTTVDHVLLFVPNESVYTFLHDNDSEILDVAMRHKVVLCSPSTLFAVLGVVRAAIDSFALEQTSNEIRDCLQKFSKQWQLFGDHLDKVERQFDTVRRSFDDLTGKRRRQLERELDRIDQLAADAGQQSLLVDPERPTLREISGG
jgi:DNA recombination protein RmuC